MKRWQVLFDSYNFSQSTNPDKWFKNYYLVRKKRTSELIGDIKGNFLDVAGADGCLSRELVNLNRKIYIIDVLPSLLKKAKNSGLIPIKADIEEKIPFKDNRFDCVLLTEILEHVFDTDKLLVEIKRILKPNGILIVSVPNVSSLCSRIMMLFRGALPNWIDCRGPHIRAYNYYLIVEQLERHGFIINKIKTNFIFIPKFRLFINWRFGFAQNLGENIIVKARCD